VLFVDLVLSELVVVFEVVLSFVAGVIMIILLQEILNITEKYHRIKELRKLPFHEQYIIVFCMGIIRFVRGKLILYRACYFSQFYYWKTNL